MEKKNEKNFSEKDKIKRLLWCDRHCCLCGKSCGIDIEFAHLPGKKNSDNIDDSIPVCSECHIKIGAYSSEHPKGTKYKAEELIQRREQVYEEYTRHLVPPIHFEITQNLPNNSQRSFPDIGFNITHFGDFFPVRASVVAKIFLDSKFLGEPGGHYSGKEFWNMNPRLQSRGHFEVPKEAKEKDKRLEIKVYVTIIDQYERYHELLPLGWVYERDKNSWWLNP